MGPDRPDRPVGPPLWISGVDSAPDQVPRRREFVRRHPEVSVTSPRENGTRMHRATWTAPGEGEVIEQAEHEELRFLLDFLEARFD